MTVSPEPVNQSPWQRVQQSLAHDCRWWLVIHTNTANVQTFTDQCTICGRRGRSYKKTSLTWEQRRSAPPFNQQLQEDWDHRRKEMWDDIRSGQDSIRQQEQERWWNWYNEYLRSEEWQNLRRRVFQRAEQCCEGCGTWPATEVHHLTYKRVGHEMLFDLVAICHDCHEYVTQSERETRTAKW
jgi:5-methylcytosine-specific restriction endonuclease McrA